MLLASIALVLIARQGMVTRSEGLLLLAAFAVYVGITFFTDWRRPPEHSVPCARALAHFQGELPSATGAMFILLFGVVGLALGAHFTVDGGIALARQFHVSEALVGLTVVAFGASLPELAVTVVAASRGRTQLAIGHLIGSNIFNILGALGATAAIHPLTVAPALAAVDVLVMLGAGVLLLPMLGASWKLSRPQGAMLLASYAFYLVFLAWRQGLLTSAMVGLG
jgi:cation:H+ antiporter